jgi:hypothetical protein
MEQTPRPTENSSEDDEDSNERMIEGAAAIAEFIYRSRDARYRRKIYYLAETSKIPIARLGSKLCLRPSKYRSWIEDQEARSVKNAKSSEQSPRTSERHGNG